MWCSLLPLLAVASARSFDNEDNVLVRWNEKHSFKAWKMSLTSGLKEEIQFWHDEHRSREDYLDGVSKVFKFDSSVLGAAEYGTKYEIHPVTIADGMDKMECMYTNGNSEEPIDVGYMLPDTYHNFEVIGYEQIEDVITMKLYFENSVESDKTYKNTLWVWHDNNNSEWIPVRYEMMSFSNWLGNLKSHDVWLYYNYKTNFTDDVFDRKLMSECLKMSEGSGNQELDLEFEKNVDREFEKFNILNNREYHQGHVEHEKRRNIFKENLRLMNERNNQNLGYTLAINQFSDRTQEELFKSQGLILTNSTVIGNIPFPYTQETLKIAAESIPAEYDLRLLGVVSPVMAQGECGCCWSIGATSAVEGALARNNGGKLLSLSNQALIDCTWSYGRAHGCDGGSDVSAYLWMMDYGLPTVEEYGIYSGQDGYCLIDNMTRLYRIKGFTDVTKADTDALKVAVVNHGPVSVLVHVTPAFLMYSGGIFFDPECDPSHLTHEVTLVGYGKKDASTFWILKNSWGTNWGIDGYMHISTMDQACGVTSKPTYVTV